MLIKFVKQEVVPYGMAPAGESDALRMVEICGRTAYKSEDKIREDSARNFVVMLKNLRHLSVLEHSNVVLKVQTQSGSGHGAPRYSPRELAKEFVLILKERNGFHRVWNLGGDGIAIAGNFRSWIETIESLKEKQAFLHDLLGWHLGRFFPNLFQDLQAFPAPDSAYNVSLMDPEEQLDLLKRSPSSDLPVFIFKFVCDRGITHEVVRHRVFSFTQESTRYVNYNNAGMVLILPEELQPFYDSESENFIEENALVTSWVTRARLLFEWYQEDLGRGLKPQIARDILPNLLKSEIFVTGRWSGWKHFIELRESPKAHPRIREIAKDVRAWFEGLCMRIE